VFRKNEHVPAFFFGLRMGMKARCSWGLITSI
jgi:hypothetical protein